MHRVTSNSKRGRQMVSRAKDLTRPIHVLSFDEKQKRKENEEWNRLLEAKKKEAARMDTEDN